MNKPTFKIFVNELKLVVFVCLLPIWLAVGCSPKQAEDGSPKNLTVIVENPLSVQRTATLVEIEVAEILKKAPDFNLGGYYVSMGGQELTSQVSKLEGGKTVVHFVVPNMAANASDTVTIVYDPKNAVALNYTKLTQAEISIKEGGYFENRKYVGGDFVNTDKLRVPAEHTDHSWYIRYEGPGWESDMVAYRFYLDWRNGVDVFGKTVSEPILQKVGLDGFDSYHKMQEWGMDVLKVGKTLGLGSIATFLDGKARRVDTTDSLYTEISNNGAIYSSINTKYYGWDLPSGKVDVASTISIHAGTRLSKISLKLSSPVDVMATGIILDPKAELIASDNSKAFSYIATYGQQSLAEDKLGLVVFYPTDLQLDVLQDGLSHVVTLGPDLAAFEYYFAAAWEQEEGGITSKEQFQRYLDQVVDELSNPVVVKF